MNYFLAVDGGGTKTHALCADEQGNVMGEGWSGSTNLTATTVGEASFNLQEALRQAMTTIQVGSPVLALSMGVAGLDTPEEIQKAETIFGQALADLHIQRMDLVNDTRVALASGTDSDNAVVLIAGTGSNCYGRNAQGQEAKAGGLDYLLTDDGSGYAIGREILRTAVRSFDGRGPKTPLEQSVCQRFQVASISELKNAVYHPLLSKTEVAEIARLMTKELLQSDPVTQHILRQACQDLSLMVNTVVKRLQLDQSPVPCVLVGGITSMVEIQTGLAEEAHKTCPQITFVKPEKPPVYGALKLAIKNHAQQSGS